MPTDRARKAEKRRSAEHRPAETRLVSKASLTKELHRFERSYQDLVVANDQTTVGIRRFRDAILALKTKVLRLRRYIGEAEIEFAGQCDDLVARLSKLEALASRQSAEAMLASSGPIKRTSTDELGRAELVKDEISREMKTSVYTSAYGEAIARATKAANIVIRWTIEEMMEAIVD
jgi:hypothetical protein